MTRAHIYLFLTSGLLVFGTLFVAGVTKVRDPRALRDALGIHDVVPGRLLNATGAAVAIVEVALGTSGLVLVLGGFGSWMVRAVCLGAALVFGLFALYLWFVSARRAPGAPCGCGGRSARVGSATIVRTVFLFSFACIGAFAAPAGALDLDAVAASLAVVSAAALGTLLWYLPLALAVPSSNLTQSTSGR